MSVLIAQLHCAQKVMREYTKEHCIIHSVDCVLMSIDGTCRHAHHVAIDDATSLTISAKVCNAGCLFSIRNYVSQCECAEIST